MTIKGTDTINPKGKEPLMRSHAVVLGMDGSDESGYVCFDVEGTQYGEAEIIKIPGKDWRDMGEPDEITVTIEPGNMLQKRFEEQVKTATIKGG